MRIAFYLRRGRFAAVRPFKVHLAYGISPSCQTKRCPCALIRLFSSTPPGIARGSTSPVPVRGPICLFWAMTRDRRPCPRGYDVSNGQRVMSVRTPEPVLPERKCARYSHPRPPLTLSPSLKPGPRLRGSKRGPVNLQSA